MSGVALHYDTVTTQFKAWESGILTTISQISISDKIGVRTTSPSNAIDVIDSIQGPLVVRIKNTYSGSGPNVHASIIVENSSSYGQLFKAGVGYAGYKNIQADDLGFFNITGGNISILNDFGNINFAANGASSPQVTINSSGFFTPKIIGGTATNSTLTFQTTSGVGAGTSDFIWKNGNNGASEAMRIVFRTADNLSELHFNGATQSSMGMSVAGIGANAAWFENTGGGASINFFFKTGYDNYIWQFGGGQIDVDDFGITDFSGGGSVPFHVLGGGATTGNQILLNQLVALKATGQGQLTLLKQNSLTTGIGLDFSTDNVLGLRNRGFSDWAQFKSGPIQITANSLDNKNVYFTGTINHSTPSALYFDTAMTGLSGGSAQVALLGGSFSLGGNCNDVQVIAIPVTTVTLNGFTVTNATSIDIQGAPTNGTNRRALWVRNDLSQFDGPVYFGGKFTFYNNIATVSNGIPLEIAKIDSTGLTANVGASTLYSVPSSGEGLYRVSAYVVETVAGSISSVLPNIQIVYTDKDSNTSVTLDVTPVLGVAGIGQTGALNANTVGTVSSGCVPIYVKASTTIQYQTVNYASTAAGMTYALHIKLEAM